MDFKTLKDFHSTYIKDKPHDILVIGNRENIDFENLAQYGSVKELDFGMYLWLLAKKGGS